MVDAAELFDHAVGVGGEARCGHVGESALFVAGEGDSAGAGSVASWDQADALMAIIGQRTI